MGQIVPAVLPSSRKEFEEKIALLARAPSVRRIQIDVVDGKFASPMSWPYTAPGELQKRVGRNEMLPELDRIEYEIDLMCLDAERAAGAWLALGATRLIFHAESAVDLPRLLATVRRRYGAGDGFASGLISYGVALNIASDLKVLEPCLADVAFVQFMGIARIGRQGQPFDRRVIDKLKMFHRRHPKIPLQIDGGVSISNMRELSLLGVSSFVIGSAIIGAQNPLAALASFEAYQTPYAA